MNRRSLFVLSLMVASVALGGVAREEAAFSEVKRPKLPLGTGLRSRAENLAAAVGGQAEPPGPSYPDPGPPAAPVAGCHGKAAAAAVPAQVAFLPVQVVQAQTAAIPVVAANSCHGTVAAVPVQKAGFRANSAARRATRANTRAVKASAKASAAAVKTSTVLVPVQTAAVVPVTPAAAPCCQ